jgi:hypothetical protein
MPRCGTPSRQCAMTGRKFRGGLPAILQGSDRGGAGDAARLGGKSRRLLPLAALDDIYSAN